MGIINEKKKERELKKKLIGWVTQQIKKEKTIVEIQEAMGKKYGEEFTTSLLKKNFANLLSKSDENKAFADLDNDINNLTAEANASVPVDEVPSIEQEQKKESKPIEDEVPSIEQEQKKESKPDEPQKIEINDMSSFKIEILNQIAQGNQLLTEVIELLKAKK